MCCLTWRTKNFPSSSFVSRPKEVNLGAMKQALILYATREGQTAKVAATLNKHLATLGVQSTAHNLEKTFDDSRLE